MYPSDEFHDMYIREKQLLLSGTAIWLAHQAADQSKGKEVQDNLIDHVLNCHNADQLLQQFIDYRHYANSKLNELFLANGKLRIKAEELGNEVERLRKIIEDSL